MRARTDSFMSTVPLRTATSIPSTLCGFEISPYGPGHDDDDGNLQTYGVRNRKHTRLEIWAKRYRIKVSVAMATARTEARRSTRRYVPRKPYVLRVRILPYRYTRLPTSVRVKLKKKKKKQIIVNNGRGMRDGGDDGKDDDAYTRCGSIRGRHKNPLLGR